MYDKITSEEEKERVSKQETNNKFDIMQFYSCFVVYDTVHQQQLPLII